MDRNAQQKDNGTTVSNWAVTAPATACTAALNAAAGFITGTVQYGISFDDANGFESNVSPISNAVNVTAQQADLTSIPTGGAGVTKRYIYRIGGGLVSALRIATIDDNSTTTYTDNITNAFAIELNITAPFDHDAPPAASGVVHYQGRMIAWNTAGNVNTIYWTKPNEYWYFPLGNFQGVGDTGEQIHACSVLGGSLYIFKERSVWRLVGDPEDGILELVTGEIGISGPRCIASARDEIYYSSRFGIYRFNGNAPQRLSGFLDPIFNGEGVATGSGDVLPAQNLQYLNTTCLEVSNNMLFVGYSAGAATTNSNMAVCNLDNGEWYHSSLAPDALHQEGPGGGFVLAVNTSLFYADNGLTDAGTAIAVDAQTAFIRLGGTDNDAQVFEVRAKGNLQDQSLTLKALFDEDTVTTPTSLGTMTGAGPWRFVVSASSGRLCRSMSLLVEGTLTKEVELMELSVSYIAHPRLTKQYITDVNNSLQENLWECRQVLAEVDPGTANFSVDAMSDGAAAGDVGIAETVAVTVTGTVGRRAYPIMLAAIQVGRLWQVGVRSTNECRVYGTKIEVRQVPIYLDGSKSQFYENEPISLGVI